MLDGRTVLREGCDEGNYRQVGGGGTMGVGTGSVTKIESEPTFAIALNVGVMG